MNLLENAAYIAAPEVYGAVCPRFRRTFTVGKDLLKACLTISALGVYEASLNGSRIGDFILAPGWTSYRKRLQYQTYDITALVTGENTLEVLLGKGWCCGRLGWEDKNPKWSRIPAIIAAVTLEYADGTRETILTDQSWKVTRSAILSSELYDGEVYDARIADGSWEDAVPYDFTHDNLIPQEGEILREVGEVPVKSVFQTPAGDTVVDFGHEFSGYIELTAEGNTGDTAEFTHFEMLDADGNVYTENLRSAQQKLTYVFAGGKAVYKPHFTYYGFRYLRVDRFPGEVKPENLRGIVLCSDMKRTGQFECSDPLINRLYENVIRGQMGNFLDVPTDCPQRDERLGWTGDAQVFCKTALLNFDAERFFGKWLADLRADQLPDGGIPCVIPDIFKEDSANSAGWADAACVCPWQVWLAYGNRDILEKQFLSMKRWVDYVRRQSDRETLWNTGHQFADWLALDKEGDQQGATDHGLIATAFFAGSTEMLIKAGNVLGRDMSEYETLHRGIISDFNRTYKDGALITPTQTAHVLALHFGLVDDRKLYADRLVRLISDNGMRLNTGFLGTGYLMETLSETGHSDIAYNLLLQQEFPSWLYSVNMGATTIWEHWDGITPDGKMWNPGMNSFNHYAYGAVASWMYGYMAGIRSDEAHPGYRHFFLNPQTDPRISYVRASYISKHGLIRSEWYAEENGYYYVFEVPAGTTATVILGNETFAIGEGHHEFIR